MARTYCSSISGLVFVVALVLSGSGCSHGPRLTTLTVEDYAFIATEITAALQADLAHGVLAERTADSPRMVISMHKVVNYTTDIISEGAKWYLLRKVKGSLPTELLKNRNIAFVISAEEVREGKRSGEFAENAFAEREPTHVMTATFRSITRSVEKDRTEAYYCDYVIVPVKDGELAFNGQVEFKRWAVGRLWD